MSVASTAMNHIRQIAIAHPSAQLLIAGAFLVAWLDIALFMDVGWATSALAAAVMIGGIVAVYTAAEILEIISAVVRQRAAAHRGFIEAASSCFFLSTITSGGLVWWAFLWPTCFVARHEDAVTLTLLTILASSLLGLSVLSPDDRAKTNNPR